MITVVYNHMTKNNGFTLSEVLITLVVLGIISAITVPSVIQSTQKQEYVSKLKKAYSVLSQSVYRVSMKNGDPVGDFSSLAEDDFFDTFLKEVNNAKLCKDSASGCFTDKNIIYLNGKESPNTFDRKNSLITVDGIAYGWSPEYCADKGLTDSDFENCIGRFIVDVNGHKSPNRYGYDVYFFAVVDGKGIVPAGSGNQSQDCTRSGKGIYCAAKVLREGAINY